MKISQLSLLVTLFLFSACGQGLKEPSFNNTSSADCSTTGPCRIFVSASTTTGDIDADNDTNGIEEADAICENDANHPGTGTFKAMIMDATNRVACTTADCGGGPGEHINWILRPNKEYRRIDGVTPIGTTTANGIFAFNLTNSITAAALRPWTGSGGDWVTNVDTCVNWTSPAGGDMGRIGDSSDSGNDTLSAGSDICSTLNVLYCVEQ